MHRALRLTLRMFVLCAVFVGIGLIAAPARVAGDGPYVSPLGALATAAFAAPSTCERQACTSRGLCAHSSSQTSCRHAGGECQTTAC